MHELIQQFTESDAVAQLLAVKPQDSFHVLEMSDDSRVTGLTPVADMSMRINGATSYCGAESLTTCMRARTWSWTGVGVPPPTWPYACRAVRRLLGTHGYPQGAHNAGSQYREASARGPFGVRDVCKNVGPSCSSQRSIRRFSEEDSLRATGGVAGQSDQGGPRWQGVGSARRTKRGPSKSSTLSPRSLASVQISSIPWGMVHWGSNAGTWLLILVKSTW